VFEKIVMMPKRQQRKIKEAICNFPVNCEETCKVLPRAPDSSGIYYTAQTEKKITVQRPYLFSGSASKPYT